MGLYLEAHYYDADMNHIGRVDESSTTTNLHPIDMANTALSHAVRTHYYSTPAYIEIMDYVGGGTRTTVALYEVTNERVSMEFAFHHVDTRNQVTHNGHLYTLVKA